MLKIAICDDDLQELERANCLLKQAARETESLTLMQTLPARKQW